MGKRRQKQHACMSSHTSVTPAKNHLTHESFPIEFNTSVTRILPKTLMEKDIRTQVISETNTNDTSQGISL